MKCTQLMVLIGALHVLIGEFHPIIGAFHALNRRFHAPYCCRLGRIIINSAP